MSYLSNKQIIFRDFLLKRLGFIDDEFLLRYSMFLEYSSQKFRFLGKAKKVIEDSVMGPILVPENENEYLQYTEYEDYFLPQKFSIIDYLNYELLLKKNKNFSVKEINTKKIISASDLSSYIFCPVSFSINNSFIIEKSESTIEGIKRHESSLLLDHIDKKVKSRTEKFIYDSTEYITQIFYNIEYYINESNQYFFDSLLNSEIVYSGHNANDKNKYFKNKKGNFIGQPDFILYNRNDGNYFCIEEKYIHEKYPDKIYDYSSMYDEYCDNNQKPINFHQNHISQINAYLHGISEYNLEYGFIIYWKYYGNKANHDIAQCAVKKILKNDTGKHRFISEFKNLSKFIREGNEVFQIDKRSSSKCANCNVSFLCGHKTGQFETLAYPYSQEYLKIKYIPFPEELKKNDQQQQ